MLPYKEILKLERSWKLSLEELEIVSGGSSIYHTMSFMAVLLCFAEADCGVLKGKFYRVMAKIGEKSVDSIKSYTNQFWIPDGLIEVRDFEGHKGTQWFYPSKTLKLLAEAFLEYLKAFDNYPAEVAAPHGYVPEKLNIHYQIDKERAEYKKAS